MKFLIIKTGAATAHLLIRESQKAILSRSGSSKNIWVLVETSIPMYDLYTKHKIYDSAYKNRYEWIEFWENNE